ncbi:MAG TPA: hypothetical protein VGC42_15395 [Kofleriaceae bacterium]
MRAGLVIAALIALAGCGDDEGAAQQPNQPATPRPGAPGAANPNAPKTPQLPERLHAEDRISCPIPDRPSDAKGGKCDLKAPSCAEHLYCLALAQGSFCEPCPERDGIRHAFKERDFATEQNRDPFQSFLLPQLTIGKRTETMAIDPTKKCPREDQLIATSYSYQDLKLVGVVAQGTQKKVLMMGGPLGYIIKRGDCVGKEKAFVKDIGAGYITFVLDPDSVSTVRQPEEYSVQLNPKQLALNDPELPQQARPTTITPIQPPTAVLPRGAGGPAGVPVQAPGTVIQPTQPTQPTAGQPPVESPPGAASTPVILQPSGQQPIVPQTLQPTKRP